MKKGFGVTLETPNFHDNYTVGLIWDTAPSSGYVLFYYKKENLHDITGMRTQELQSGK